MKKLLLIMTVFVLLVTLVACGGPAETGTPDSDVPGTDAPETDAPETDAPLCNGKDIHDIEVVEVPATCQMRGYRKETCKVCGEELVNTAYPKTECTPVAAPTCTEASVCSVCGEVVEEATGHVASDNVVQDLGCSVVYSCAGVGCSETITLTKENAQHTVTIPEVIDDTLTIKNGQVSATCTACGEVVPVPEEVKLMLNFDKGTVAEEFETYPDVTYTIYDDESKGLNAQIKESGDRSVLYFKWAKPLFIDYELSFLSDAKVFTITFDYCVGKAPYAPSNQVSLFTFTPGMQDGAILSGRSCPWIHSIKFDRTSLYFTDGKTNDPTQYFQPEIGKWYTITLVVDNEFVNSSGKNNGKVYVFVDGEFIRSAENAGCTQYVLDTYGGLSWRIGEMGNTHDPLYDNFKVAVIK